MRPSEAAAAWLRGHLGRLRISKSEAATLAGMPQQTFSRKINGQTPFTLDELHDMAVPLRYRLRDLLDGAEDLMREDSAK